MQWLTPENPSEPEPSGDPTSPVPPAGSSGDPTLPTPHEGGVGPYRYPSNGDPTGPFSPVGPVDEPTGPIPVAEPTGPVPVADAGGTGSPGSPGWTPPPTGGGGTGGAGGTVPPWGWPSGSWPGGYYGPPNPPRRRRSGLVIAAILAALLLAGGGIGAGVTLAFAGGSSPSHVAAPSSRGKSSPLDASAIAAKVDKGVVDITAQEAYEQGQALGTGMILTSNGEVLTNNHVVDGASPMSISVRPVDGQKSYSATVIGVDPTADVALLQMHGASGLTPVQLGDSSKVKVGTSVVAIGNAGGQGGTPTVTQGAVTALNRSITASDENGSNPENLTGMLQTSAQLASGDSGGPLVNAAGQVIGMDTAAPGGQLSDQVSGTPSVGWAIPTNKALSVVSQIRSKSNSSNIVFAPHAFMGVSVTDASSVGQGSGGFGGFPGRFNPSPPAVSSGAYVEQALPGSPAASAGLQTGDVITSLDGQTVTSEKDLTNVENSLHAGDSVSIGWVDSSGQSHSGTITLGAVVA